jgi:hypothetical protein
MPAGSMDDLLIRGGHLIDGSGGPGRDADVAVRSGHIVAVEPRSARPAHRVIDARGQVVAPGFIDIQRSPAASSGEAPEPVMDDHWGREHLAESMFAALAAAGKELGALTIDDLAATDQFHGGGKAATVRLANLFGAKPGLRVLDVGGGLGGPARTLAVEFGCLVTVVDLTESYVRAARLLTARLGLDDHVSHHVGNALDLRFDGGAFDVVWTQNSGMNIADKDRLYAEFHRVLCSAGLP